VANTWSLAVVTGTPAASPSEPAAPANSIVLAMVSVAALATSITNANITDRRFTQSGQEGSVAALGGVIICTSTSRPTQLEGRVIYETDTDRVYVSTGTNWRQLNPGIDAQMADVATSQGTTSSSYTDLTTVGPAVTVHLEPGQKCEVTVYARQLGDAGTTGPRMSFAVSGAETIAASDTNALEQDNTQGTGGSRSTIFTATTGGTYTFTAKYKRTNATTATFADRRIIAKPL
jgi:predicted secreted protein